MLGRHRSTIYRELNATISTTRNSNNIAAITR
ncbi:hypothetical protein [Phyllobacterium zundukense]